MFFFLLLIFFLPFRFDCIIIALKTNRNTKLCTSFSRLIFGKCSESFLLLDLKLAALSSGVMSAHRDRWRHPCLIIRCTMSLKLVPSLVLVVVDVLWFLEVDTVPCSVLFSRCSSTTCFHITDPASQTFEWKRSETSFCTYVNYSTHKPKISISAGIMTRNRSRRQ